MKYSVLVLLRAKIAVVFHKTGPIEHPSRGGIIGYWMNSALALALLSLDAPAYYLVQVRRCRATFEADDFEQIELIGPRAQNPPSLPTLPR